MPGANCQVPHNGRLYVWDSPLLETSEVPRTHRPPHSGGSELPPEHHSVYNRGWQVAGASSIGWMERGMARCVGGWMDKRMDGQTDKYMDGQMYVYMMNGWMGDVSKNEQMEEWMEGWMVGITSCLRIMSRHGMNHAKNPQRSPNPIPSLHR